MTTYAIVNPGNLATGQAMHVEDVLANFQAIQAVVNGGIDDSNVSGGIALSKVSTLIFTQSSPSASWSIAHNLGKFPSVDVVDSGGNVLMPDILYVDLNNITVNFGAATSGKAYIN
jgi:hypothetical protein